MTAKAAPKTGAPVSRISPTVCEADSRATSTRCCSSPFVGSRCTEPSATRRRAWCSSEVSGYFTVSPRGASSTDGTASSATCKARSCLGCRCPDGPRRARPSPSARMGGLISRWLAEGRPLGAALRRSLSSRSSAVSVHPSASRRRSLRTRSASIG